MLTWKKEYISVTEYIYPHKEVTALKEEPNFDRITINGVDKKTSERLAKEFQRWGYRTKTEFLTFLWKKALDDIDAERSLEHPGKAENVSDTLNEIRDSLMRIERSQERREVDDVAYRKLLIEIYWMAYLIATQGGGDVSAIEDGKMDFLPVNLALAQRKAEESYGKPERHR